MKKWERIPPSDPLDRVAGERFKKRVQRMKDPLFLAACTLMDIEATPRQARRWNQKVGLAYKNREKARAVL